MKHEINWVALGLALGPRSHLLKPLLRQFKTPEAVFDAGKESLLACFPDMGKGILASLTNGSALREATRLATWCHQSGVVILTPDDARYPAGLFDIAEPPAVLYCRGKLPLPAGIPTVGVVGMRDADAYGARVTYKLSFELAAAGAVTVSGLAQGVDGVAAAATLDAGGHTVAVLGCGIDMVYPKHHDRLFKEICEYGTVLTEYPPGTRPNGWNFPMRNRIISALSDALVVTEADEDSGALITARYALVQGKTLFAVPGNIDSFRSAGTNQLLRSGALMALSAEDILAHFRFLYKNALQIAVPPEAMQFAEATARKLRAHGVIATFLEEENILQPEKTKPVSGLFAKKRKEEKREAKGTESIAADAAAPALELLDLRQRELYEMLPNEVFSVDHLVSKGVPAGEAAATLTVLELYGIIVSRPGGLYRKK